MGLGMVTQEQPWPPDPHLLRVPDAAKRPPILPGELEILQTHRDAGHGAPFWRRLGPCTALSVGSHTAATFPPWGLRPQRSGSRTGPGLRQGNPPGPACSPQRGGAFPDPPPIAPAAGSGRGHSQTPHPLLQLGGGARGIPRLPPPPLLSWGKGCSQPLPPHSPLGPALGQVHLRQVKMHLRRKK